MKRRLETITEIEQKVLASILEAESDQLDDLLATVSAQEIAGVTERQYRAAVRTLLAKFRREWK
jgi:DNA-binding MarR family transcriptional regulator